MKNLKVFAISLLLLIAGYLNLSYGQSTMQIDPLLGGPSKIGCDARIGYDINAATGNLYTSYTDIVVFPALAPALQFTRHYNSQGTHNNVGFGRGWTHTYSWRVSMPDDATIRLLTSTGRAIYFTKNTTTGYNWKPPIGEFGTLTGTADKGFIYRNKFGMVYTFDKIANLGRLLSISPPDNTPIKISYFSGINIYKVTAGDRSLTFSYKDGNIYTVKDSIGNVWTYDVKDSLNAVTLPNTDSKGVHGKVSYFYTDVVINGVTFSSGNQEGKLTRITLTQSDAVTVDTGIFSYNTGKIIRAALSAINKSFQNDVKLTYYSNETLILINGGSRRITLNNISGSPRITKIMATAGVDRGWTSTTFVWNADLTLKSLTDGKGNVVTYLDYDSKGNPRTIAEASGTPVARTTKITYHPVLSVPLTIKNLGVDGINYKTLTYDYDSDYDANYNALPTNYLHQTIMSGKTNAYLSDNPDVVANYSSKIYYDSKNQVIQFQFANGSSVFMEYWPALSANNASNRLKSMSIKTSDTAQLDFKFLGYDKNGRLQLSQNQKGIFANITYNSLGSITAIEQTDLNPLANVVNTTNGYAIADQSISNVETDTLPIKIEYLYNLANQLISYIAPGGMQTKYDYDGASLAWRVYSVDKEGNIPWSKVFTYNNQKYLKTYRRFAGLGSQTAPLGTEELYMVVTHDTFGRISSVQTPDNSYINPAAYKVSYNYDNNGNLKSITNAGLQTKSFMYDQLNRLIRSTLPTGNYTTYSYDTSGHIITITDAKDAANGGSGGTNRKYKLCLR